MYFSNSPLDLRKKKMSLMYDRLNHLMFHDELSVHDVAFDIINLNKPESPDPEALSAFIPNSIYGFINDKGDCETILQKKIALSHKGVKIIENASSADNEDMALAILMYNAMNQQYKYQQARSL